ncbi:MAG: cupin domain-containing protein [Oscillospiraceae bacterium]|nr:cupin domain-containing protein [Oscillospiraceae bacterium]
MRKLNIYKELEGTEFPAGRRTRVFVGADSPLQADRYVVGTADVHPGGGVPEHAHETEETYIILSGTGVMLVDGEEVPIGPNDVIYLEPMQPHELRNTGDTEMRTMFVYAPKMVVDHWAQETSGELKMRNQDS